MSQTQNQFVQKLFDERAPVYDEWVRGFWTAYADRIDREVGRVVSQRRGPISWLDVGCGTASRLKRLLEGAPRRKFSRLAACDLSWGMVEEARKNLSGKKAGLFQGNAACLPLRSEAFDLASMLYAVLGCLPSGRERRGALAECARTLRPGGVAIVDVLSRQHQFYRERPEVFQKARAYKKERGWAWEEGDLLVEVEKDRPSLNHGFERVELDALTEGLFSKALWRCYDTETGLPGDERTGHFFGVLRK